MPKQNGNNSCCKDVWWQHEDQFKVAKKDKHNRPSSALLQSELENNMKRWGPDERNSGSSASIKMIMKPGEQQNKGFRLLKEQEVDVTRLGNGRIYLCIEWHLLHRKWQLIL